MVLLLDNYDSFTYNLYQMSAEIYPDIKVIKNDEMSVEEIKEMDISHIIISPGPGRPEDAGICTDLVKSVGGKIPVLGVCLGHQAICEAYGGRVVHAKKLVHGKSSYIHIANASPVFRGIAPITEVGRYHSLCVEKDTLPDNLLIIAEDSEGEIMGVKHRDYQIYGLQFHPESVLTEKGEIILRNFLGLKEGKND